MWCAYHNLYNHTADFVSGKKYRVTRVVLLFRFVLVLWKLQSISDSLLLTSLCCDDIHDVTPRISALAREDLEALWSLVKERFSTAKPKNFSDYFLLTTLGAMFEKPDAHA
nr:hypothetical protein [Tanacetum cinerariifolium]